MLLAIETATAEVGVAVAGPGGVLATATLRAGRRHAETLHPLLAAVAVTAGVDLAQAEAVAVDIGPGLFTGLRVGVAAAKALGFALGVPLVTLRSTEVLLHACRSARRPVAAVVDLRRGEIAWSFAGERPGDPVLGTPAALAGRLAALPEEALLVGDGARRHGELLAGLVAAAGGPAPLVCGDELAAPPVASLADLALERWRAGALEDPFAVTPCYLREADVRIGWATRATDAGSDAATTAPGGGDSGVAPAAERRGA